MESKVSTEQHEAAAIDEKEPTVRSDSPQLRRLSKRAYLASTGLFLGWIAQQQMNVGASTVLSDIDADLGPITNYSWLFTTWLVCVAIFSAPLGSLADRIGRRYFFIVGNVFALIGAIICAAAQSVNVVIVGMTFGGIGAAHQQLAVAGLSEIFPNKYRAYVQGAVQLSAFPFVACGNLVGFSMAKYATWRWVYYLNIILDGLALIAVVLLYHPPLPNKETPRWQLIKSADWIGISVSILGVVGLGLGFGPAAFGLHGWGTAAVLVPLILGIAILVAVGFWMRYGSSDPLHPPEIFNVRGFSNLLLIVTAIYMPVYALTFVWSQEVQAVYTTDPIKIGLYNFPAGFGAEVGAFIAALVVRKLGRTNLQLAIACLVLAIFTGLQATLTPNSIKPALGYMSIGGLAIGYIQVISVVMIQLEAPDKYIGDATGLLISFRTVGAALGVSICLTIVKSKVGSTWPHAVAEVTVPLGLPATSLPALLGALQTQSVPALMAVPGISPQIIEAATVATKVTYAAAFRLIYYPALALGVVGTVLSLFAKDVTPLMTNHLAVDMAQSGSHLLATSRKGAKRTNV